MREGGAAWERSTGPQCRSGASTVPIMVFLRPLVFVTFYAIAMTTVRSQEEEVATQRSAEQQNVARAQTRCFSSPQQLCRDLRCSEFSALQWPCSSPGTRYAAAATASRTWRVKRRAGEALAPPVSARCLGLHTPAENEVVGAVPSYSCSH
ncbi:hypothetical protein O3P69_019941 [Scylla paramamosain]|uniref:Uncharacterized protein n=1 Tax=Scylla paramamosain TaxID=85552 RepID=A0AAW0SII8_SCYPA